MSAFPGRNDAVKEVGPQLNPAGVKRQLIGITVPQLAPKLGEALLRLGSERVLIVYSSDGLDEISPAAPSTVSEFKRGEKMKEFVINPTAKFSLNNICGGEPAENKRRSLAILSGQGSAAENEFVALNAGLALYLSDVVSTPAAGREKALEILKSGAATSKLEELIKITNSL